jgi:hydroxymethylglutaryl-CoA lyase
MSKILFYPKCAKSFIDFCHSEKHLTNKFVNKLRKVKPFDVSLRDGLQGLSKEEQLTIKPIDQINLYFKIKEKYEPINMEIGSIVSSNVLPIFNNSDSFYNYIEYCQLTSLQDPDEPKINNFILIPNEKQFNNIHKFMGLRYFSFITSVSESFQLKNTRMTLDTTFEQLNNMMRILDDKPEKSTVKLYVSCINECPIEGKIDNNIIIEKILKYQELKPDILCLSDTCGTLTVDDLNYIILNLKDKNFNNLSLHLHVKPGREDEVEQIIHTALDFGITSFDVSVLKSGGCSVTMNKSDLAPNLSYELYYKSLATYLLKDS